MKKRLARVVCVLLVLALPAGCAAEGGNSEPGADAQSGVSASSSVLQEASLPESQPGGESGASSQVPPQEPLTPQDRDGALPQKPEGGGEVAPLPAEPCLYIMGGEQDLSGQNLSKSMKTVVNQNGQVLMTGKDISLVYDSRPDGKNAPVYFTQSRVEIHGGGPWDYTLTSALYDANGNLVMDWQPHRVEAVFGDWARCVSGGTGGYMQNIHTGERRYEGANQLKRTGNGCYSVNVGSYVSFWETNIEGVVDRDMNPVRGFPFPKIYQSYEIYEGYELGVAIVQDRIDDQTQTRFAVDIYDTEGKLCLELVSDTNAQQLHGNCIAVTNGGSFAVWDAARRVKLIELEEPVTFCDGAVMVTGKDGRYYLRDMNGTELAGPYNTLQARTDDANNTKFLFAADTKSDVLHILQTDGQALYTREVQWLLNAGLGERGIWATTRRNSVENTLLLNDDLTDCPVSQASGRRDALYYGEGLYKQYRDTAAGQRIDIVDEEGRVHVGSLTAVIAEGPGRLAVQWGMYKGLIDYNGTWLYRQAVEEI